MSLQDELVLLNATFMLELNGLWSGCDWADRKVDGFHRRAEIVEEGNGDEIAPSSTLNSLLEDENIELPDVRNVIMEHLERRALEFEYYWPEDVMEYRWVTVMWKILLMPFQTLLAFKSSVLRSKQQTVLQFLGKNMITEFFLDQR